MLAHAKTNIKIYTDICEFIYMHDFTEIHKVFKILQIVLHLSWNCGLSRIFRKKIVLNKYYCTHYKEFTDTNKWIFTGYKISNNHRQVNQPMHSETSTLFNKRAQWIYIPVYFYMSCSIYQNTILQSEYHNYVLVCCNDFLPSSSCQNVFCKHQLI